MSILTIGREGQRCTGKRVVYQAAPAAHNRESSSLPSGEIDAALDVLAMKVWVWCNSSFVHVLDAARGPGPKH